MPEFSETFLLVISGWSTLNGILIGLYLFFYKWTKKNEANKILGIVFFVISFKTILPIICSTDSDSTLLCNLYYRWAIICYTAIGPLLLIYTKSLTDNIFYFKKQQLLMFLPIIVFLFLPDSLLFTQVRFYIIQIWMLVFIGISVFFILKKSKTTSSLSIDKKKWLSAIIIGIFIIWITVFTARYIELIAFFSFITASMAYIILEKKEIIHFDNYIKETNSEVIVDYEKEDIIEKLNEEMKTEKPFLNADLSLPELSDNISFPLHKVSKSINEVLGINFSEYINSFRISEAKNKLIDADYSHLSIAGIAFECGFNSLSTFNTAFKKQTNVTPSKYRKSINL